MPLINPHLILFALATQLTCGRESAIRAFFMEYDLFGRKLELF